MQPISFSGYLKIGDNYVNTKKISTIQIERNSRSIPTKATITLDNNKTVEVKTGALLDLPNKANSADYTGEVINYTA